jgi:ABC-type uncharacterized transport system substrate-binding protein
LHGRRAVLVAAVALSSAGPAAAHPHILIDAAAEALFDDQGRLAGLRNVWTFDEDYSAYAIMGLDEDGDGSWSEAELAPLARLNVESLAEYHYFTEAWSALDAVDLGTPTDARLVYDGARLTLSFVVPLAQPMAVQRDVTFAVYDPEYYVAFFFDATTVSVENRADCAATYEAPEELDVSIVNLLAAVPADQRALPAELSAAVDALANQIIVSCP